MIDNDLKNLYSIFEGNKDKETNAIVFGKEELSYKELYSKSSLLSCYLKKRYAAFSRIAICFPNSIEFIVSSVCAYLLEKTLIPIDNRLTSKEIYETLNFVKCDILLTTKKNIKKFANFKDINIIYYEDLDCFLEMNEIEMSYKGAEYDALILRTSGSTNEPKYVVLSNKAICENICMNCKSLNLEEIEKSFIVLPLNYVYSHIAQLLSHLYLGATLILNDKMMLSRNFTNTIKNGNITNFFITPGIMKMILSDKNLKEITNTALKKICCGGAKTDSSLISKIFEIFPDVDLYITYGITETSSRVSTNVLRRNHIYKPNSVGIAMNGIEVFVINKIDDNIGELLIKTPSVMKCYLNNEIETKAVLKNDIYYSGDMGYVDSEGYIFITGRKKNIIIYAGANIFPEEIEEIILKCKDVIEVKVYSYTNEMGDELVAADIIKIGDTNLNKKNVIEHCKMYLPSFKIPKKINFVKEIEHTKNGKLKRF